MKKSRSKEDPMSQSLPLSHSASSPNLWETLPRIKEGYLVKAPRSKGNDKVRKGWQERYFILVPGKLLYFKSKGDKKIKGEISLKECAVVDTDQQFVFKVSELDQKCFTYLRAPSADVKQDWIEKIQKAIAEVVLEERVGGISAGGFANVIATGRSGSVSVKRDLVAADATSEKFEISSQTKILTDDSGAQYEGEVNNKKQKNGWGVLKSQGHKYEGYWLNDQMHGQGIFTHATGVRYEGEWINGKQHGFGTLMFPSGALYVGAWENGLRHGKGVMLSMNGCKYDGEFVKGMQHGKGVLLWANGNKYEGDFKENKGHGVGKFEYADGVTYEGEFVNGKFHGKGKLKFNKSREYEGMFVEDAYSGPGLLQFGNGDYYEGFCKRHCREGIGSMHWANGNEYEGEWKEDQMHGSGRFTSPDGHVYEGEFKEGVRQGKGVMTFPDKKKYEGNWVGGNMNGQGSMYYPNGNIFVGNWVNGQKEGDGSFVWNDGRKFNGTYVNGTPNGKGLFMNALGERYEGDYVDGKKQGKGQYHFQNGDIYEGDWDNNFMHGQGVKNYRDGTRYEGEWTNDVRGEKGKFFWPNGDVFDGVFGPDGEFIGGVIQYGNGNRYEGEVLNGKRNGVGVMFWVIGERFEGHWKNGKRHGYGVMYLLDGRITEGTYEDDRCVNLTIREKKQDEEDLPPSLLPMNEMISRQSIAVFREASKSVLKPNEGDGAAAAAPEAPIVSSSPAPPTELQVLVDAPIVPMCAADEDMDLEKNITFEKIDKKPLAEDLISSNDSKLEIGRSSEVNKTLNLANERGKAKNIKSRKKHDHDEPSLSDTKDTTNHDESTDSEEETEGDQKEDHPEIKDAEHGHNEDDLSNSLSADFHRESRAASAQEFLATAPASLVQPKAGKSVHSGNNLVSLAEEKPVEDFKAARGSGAQAEDDTATQGSRISETSVSVRDSEPDPVSIHVLDSGRPSEEPIAEPPKTKVEPPTNVPPSVTTTLPAIVENSSNAPEERKSKGDESKEPRPSKPDSRASKPAPPRTSEQDLEYVRIADWTVDQTCSWLQKNNFPQFVPFFKEKNWDGNFMSIMELNSFSEFGSKLSLIQKRNLIFTVDQLKSRQKTRASHAPSFSGASPAASEEENRETVAGTGAPVAVNVSKLRLFWERNATLELR